MGQKIRRRLTVESQMRSESLHIALPLGEPHPEVLALEIVHVLVVEGASGRGAGPFVVVLAAQGQLVRREAVAVRRVVAGIGLARVGDHAAARTGSTESETHDDSGEKTGNIKVAA